MLNVDRRGGGNLEAGRLDAAFAALADPTRRAILSRLADGDAAVLELAAPFRVSLPAISRHLKVLESAGLIERSKVGRQRPCRLRPDALREVTAWADHTREVWEARFDRLEDHLTRARAEAEVQREREGDGE